MKQGESWNHSRPRCVYGCTWLGMNPPDTADRICLHTDRGLRDWGICAARGVLVGDPYDPWNWKQGDHQCGSPYFI